MIKVAIIPARGGSKRIPRKNIREFVSKPMIAHSIETALESEVFDRVIVSTDDQEIAEIALQWGAEVPFLRPIELANDYAGTIDVMIHAINWLNNNQEALSAICCIYATAPFIQKKDIRKGLMLLESGNWQYVFSATTFGFPIFRGFRRNTNDGLEMFFPEYFQTRSQDLPQAMHDAGQFYWGRPEAWLNRLQIFDQWSTVVELPRWRVQDIDTLEDWTCAEFTYRLMKEIMKENEEKS